MDRQDSYIQRQDSHIQRLENAQLRFQEQLGEMAGIMRQVIARQEQHDREICELRQRQAESDQRFEVMLQEIRFLIRQRPSTEDGSDSLGS